MSEVTFNSSTRNVSVYYIAAACLALLVMYFLWKLLTPRKISTQTGDNDVLTLHHAPWCGHCKHFMPEYDKFAEVAKHKYTNLDVKKIDCTSAKCPEDIRGYPTVRLTRGGTTSEFNGPRTFEGLCNFVEP